jgi:N-acetyl-anhydromuramyl-L-alanine amidase AmpD
MRDIKRILIHCSDSKTGDVATIREWHLKKGFSDIGYHFVILLDGTVQEGRSVSIAGAHCEGNNSDSIGVCLVGVNDFSTEQVRSLMYLVLGLMQQHKVPIDGVFCHYELDNKGKVCPYIPGAFMRFLLQLEVPFDN